MATEQQPHVCLDRVSLAVRLASHAEETRYAMNGVLVEPRGFVATDGHIMAHITHKGGEIEGLEGRVLSNTTIKATLKAMSGREGGNAILGSTLRAMAPATKATKAKPSKPAVYTDVELEVLPGSFPPWEEVIKPGDHLDPIETNLDALDAISSVLGDHGVARITYDQEGFIGAEAKGEDYTASVRFSRLPAKEDEEHLAGFDPGYLGTIARIVREFHKGENWADAITLWLPNGRNRRLSTRGTEARAGLFVHAKRTDGRELTVLLMPIVLS